MARVSTRLCFPNPRGLQLVADLLLPLGHPPFPAVLFAHDLMSDKEDPLARLVAVELAREGIATMLLDLAGHGESEGTPAESSPEEQAGDLGAALDELEQRRDIDPRGIGLLGSGTGALSALLRAERDPRARVMVLHGPRSPEVLDVVRRVALPVLIVVGSQDDQMLQAALALQAALVGEKKVAVVEGALGPFDDPAHRQEIAILTVDWFLRHLRG